VVHVSMAQDDSLYLHEVYSQLLQIVRDALLTIACVKEDRVFFFITIDRDEHRQTMLRKEGIRRDFSFFCQGSPGYNVRVSSI
jgi:hypothetical protein